MPIADDLSEVLETTCFPPGCLNGAPITSCFGFYPAEPDLIVSIPCGWT